MGMKPGYYWYRHKRHADPYKIGSPPWHICFVVGRLVHFFGEVSQELDGEYVRNFLEIDPIPIGPSRNLTMADPLLVRVSRDLAYLAQHGEDVGISLSQADVRELLRRCERLRDLEAKNAL